jgi:hypothetical protein
MGGATNLTPLYGRSLPGERVYGAKPTAPGKRISTVGALGLSGLKTAMCFEGTLRCFCSSWTSFGCRGSSPARS